MRWWLLILLATTAPAEKKRRHFEDTGTPPPSKSSPSKIPTAKSDPAAPQKKGPESTGHSESHPTETGAPVTPLAGAPDESRALHPDPVLNGVPCARKPSLEQLFRIPRPRAAQGAPKGGVYFLVDQALLLLEGRGLSPREIATGVTWYEANPQGESVLLARQKEGETELSLFDGKNAGPPLKQAGVVSSARWASDGSLYFIVEKEDHGELARLHAADHQVTPITRLEGPHFLSDVSPDGRYVAMTALRPAAGSRALIWDLTLRRALSVGKGRSRDPRFTSSSQAVFFLSEVKDHLQLHFASLKTLQKARSLSTGPWSVEWMALSGDRKALAYSVNEEGYSQLGGLLVDDRGGQRRNLPLPALAKGVVEEVAFARSSDETAFFLIATNSREPAEIWQSLGGTAQRWSQFAADKVDSACLAAETLVKFPALDKLPISAFLYGGTVRSPKPFVVLVEGMPETQFRPRFHPLVQYFVEQGFGVLAPNGRGREGYGRTFQNLDDGQARMKSYGDLVGASRWLVSQKYSEASHVGLVGEGYGGWVSLRALAEAPKEFAGAALAAPWLDFEGPLKGLSPLWRAFGEAEYGLSTNGPLMRKLSALGALEALKKAGIPVDIKGSTAAQGEVSRARAVVSFLQSISPEKRKGSR